MESFFTVLRRWWHGSAFVKVMFIGFVILLLQIPVSMISGQINERQWTKQEAVTEVAGKWGKEQILSGPRLVIPYYEMYSWKNKDGHTEHSRKKRYASFLPKELNVNAEVNNQTRYRGIFEVPLYQSNITVKGHFEKPNFERWGIQAEHILWGQAELVIGLSGANSIQKNVQLKWGDNTYEVESGLGKSNHTESGFHARLNEGFASKSYAFNIKMDVNGSQRLFVAPTGKSSLITINSNWPDPSFQGNKLPTQHRITNEGFVADWHIPAISLSYPQQWLTHKFDLSTINQSLVGVAFISPVDNYRMTERSVKYAVLFLILTFTVIWVFELTTNIKVHLLQYLLIGMGMSLFYLLLLALSEHISFVWAYVIASILVITMTSTYAKVALKSSKRALLIGVLTTAMYTYLYTLLQEQNYALLTGAIGTFLALGTVMYTTRNINWFAVNKSGEES